MQLANITSTVTYLKSIKYLDEFGYIKYILAGHRYMKSFVYISGLAEDGPLEFNIDRSIYLK